MKTDDLNKVLKGIKIAGIDYGLKRTAIAVTDELHISITPKLVFDTEKDDFLQTIIDFIINENIGAIVIGMPVREDNIKTDVIKAIEDFKNKLESKLDIPIYYIDESFSTIRATETMFRIGKSKKKRREKGNKDLIAAGLILKSFIDENGL